MTSPELLFNSLRLEVLVPDELLDLPESITDSDWVSKLERLPQRPASYFG